MKKNIIISCTIFIFLSVLFISYYCIKKLNFSEINTIKIIKKPEIIKNSENPIGILKYDGNLEENIFSGFFIDKNTILTVAHGVNNEKSIYEIIDKKGGKYYGELILKDSVNDFAKIKTNSDFRNFKKINIGNNIKVGEKIYSYSFSRDGYNLEKKSGTIIDIDNDKIKTNIVFQEGNSGGMVINEKNQVIGIIIGVDKKEKAGYFIKINEILKK